MVTVIVHDVDGSSELMAVVRGTIIMMVNMMMVVITLAMAII